MSIIMPEILIHHSVKAILYMVTILCSTGSQMHVWSVKLHDQDVFCMAISDQDIVC